MSRLRCDDHAKATEHICVGHRRERGRRALRHPRGFESLESEDLAAPPLTLSESLSALHEMRWREEVPDDTAKLGLRRRREMPVRIERPPSLSDEAWRVAGEFGWAKTYEAEYVALARILTVGWSPPTGDFAGR